MAPGDVCHGPSCSLAGLRPVALGYRPSCWPGGSTGSPQCVRPMGCWFFPTAPCVCTCVRCLGPFVSCSLVCPLGALFCLCGVLGHLAPVHRCACMVFCIASAVAWATWLLFNGVPAWFVALRVRCPGPLGSCSTVCPVGVLFCLCGLLGHLAPVHRCARTVLCVACAVSWATWLLFTGVPARCVVLSVRCPGPLRSCSAVCPLGVLLGLCGVLGHLAPIQHCVLSVCCLCVQCPWPLGSCSAVCPLGALVCLCGVLAHLAPVHRCARLVPCFACAVSLATWLLFTGVPARCVVLCVRCPAQLGYCSLVCPLGVSCCVCGVLGPLALVHRCACPVCRAVSWASWLLFTGVPTRCVVLRLRCPGPLGSSSPVCPLGALRCVCGVLARLAPVHRCARSVRCFACAVSWATWLLFTGAPAWLVVKHVRCPGPLGSCSLMCLLGLLFCLCGVLGHLAPVHRYARSVRCFACAVSWATWLLIDGLPAWFVVKRVRCPGPLGSCSPVCLLGLLFCLCCVLGHFAPVHRCACSVCCLACAVSWATWLLFSVVPPRCVACVWGVPGHLAPVHRCACSVRCFACVVSRATWLLFKGVPARCVVLRVRCPGPLGSCSLVRSPCVLCGVLGPLAHVHPCARSMCCAVGCMCGAALRGAHASIQTAAICSWQGLGTLRARTRPSGLRLFVAGRGLVPSGRTRVHPDGGCSVAGRGWVRCRAHTRLSRWRLVLLCTCSRAVVRCVLWALSGFAAPGGRCRLTPVCVRWLWLAACLSDVLLGPAWCAALHPVWSLSLRLLVHFPTPRALLGGCAGHAEAGREPGLLCLPLAPAEAGALGWLRFVPVQGPAMGLSLAVPSGVGLGLPALRWLACVDPVSDGSGFLYCPSFHRGLSRCTQAVSCGRPHLPLRVVGRNARVPCVCTFARPSTPGRAGRPPGGVLVRLTFFSGRFVFLYCFASTELGLLLSWSFLCPPAPPFSFSSLFLFRPVVVFRVPSLSLAFFGFWPRVPWALALCAV